MSTQNSWNNKVSDANVTLNGGTIAISTDSLDNVVNIATAANTGRVTTIGNATGTSSLVLIAGSGGSTLDATGAIGVNSSGAAISIGTDADDFNISLGTAGTRTITVGNNTATSALALISGSTGTTADSTGVIELNSTGGAISVGNDADDQNINIGTAGTRAVTVGNNTATSSLALIAGSTGATIDSTGVVEINSTAGVISVGNDADDQNINIGTAGTRAITVGNATATTGLDLVSGSTGTNVDSTGAIAINSSAGTISVGNDVVNQDINIGTAGTRTVTVGTSTAISALDLISGATGTRVDSTGVVEINSSGGAISIGNDADAQDVNIATDGARSVTVGNNADAATVVDIIGGATNGVRINNDINSPIAIGSGTSTGAITIGNDAGAVSQTINVATGNVTTGVRQVNIGTGTVGAGTQDIAIGNADANTTLTINGVAYKYPTAIGSVNDVLAISSTAPNVLSWATKAGDVTGPGSATDNAIARFDLTTGKIIQNSGVIIDDSDNVTGVAEFTSAGTASINDSANFATTINTGTSTGAVTIGSSNAGAIGVQSGTSVGLTGVTNINVSANNATNINTGTSTGAVTIGSSNAGAIAVESGTSVGLTGVTSINASANNATNINTGTSTGAVSIGNSAAGAIAVESGTSVGLTGVTNINASANNATNINTGTSTGAVIIGNSVAGQITIRSGAGSNLVLTGGATASAGRLIFNQIPAGTYQPIERDSSSGIIYRNTSSIRYKENLQSLTDGSWIYKTQAKTYNYIGDDKKIPQVGWVAEEIEKINPQLVTYDAEGCADGLRYFSALPSIVEEMKKLKLYTESLEKRVAECELKLNKGV